MKNIEAKYGLSRDDYAAILKAQEGRCAACEQTFIGVRGPFSPCVDHDHVTGEIRGLLCRHCNFAIGLADDNPETLRAMAAYLEGAQ